MALFTLPGVIHPVPPFRLEHALTFLSEFPALCDEPRLGPNTLTMPLSVGGQALVVRLRGSGSAEKPLLHYRLYSAHPIGEYTELAAIDHVRFFLSLDDDLHFFYTLGQGDAHFAPVMERLYGYHQVKFPSPFEGACWAILSQHNLITVARRMKQSIVEQFGARVEIRDRSYTAFPDAARLARAGERRLQTAIGNPRRAAYVAAAAGAFAKVDHTFLREAPYADVEAWLRNIPGVGPWSATFVMIRGLGRMERVPHTDRVLAQAVSAFYRQGRPTSPDTVRRLAARYGPWQGYWAHYLRALALMGTEDGTRRAAAPAAARRVRPRSSGRQAAS